MNMNKNPRNFWELLEEDQIKSLIAIIPSPVHIETNHPGNLVQFAMKNPGSLLQFAMKWNISTILIHFPEPCQNIRGYTESLSFTGVVTHPQL